MPARYDVKINGTSIGSYDDPKDALNAACNAMKAGWPSVPDIIDTHVGMPFERSSIIDWCSNPPDWVK